MHITTTMMRELEEAIAPDAQAEIRVYAAGCDIRVSWNNGLNMANKNIAYQEVGSTRIAHDRMMKAWQRLIAHFQELKRQGDQRQGEWW